MNFAAPKIIERHAYSIASPPRQRALPRPTIEIHLKNKFFWDFCFRYQEASTAVGNIEYGTINPTVLDRKYQSSGL